MGGWQDEDETTWLAEARALPSDRLVTPTLTVGDLVRFYSRPRTPEGARFEQGAVYGRGGAGGRPLTLHLYARSDPAERRPGVVFVHGGAWEAGHPFAHIRRACLLAGRGYVTATISYRLSGEARWPAALEDVKCAVRWMRHNAAGLGLDEECIVVAGDSAGGHLAAMVALTPRLFEGSGGHQDETSAVQGAILLYPATDLRSSPQIRAAAARLIGDYREDALVEASPIRYVSPAAPPVLTITGATDEIIPLEAVRAFHAALDSHGVDNELVFQDGWGHGFDWDPQAWEISFARLRFFLESRFPAVHLPATPTAPRAAGPTAKGTGVPR